MKNVKAYDLPLRIIHWLFAAIFITSFGIAKIIDDESTLFAYHMISGILMAVLLLIRIVWFFIGEKTSKISSFKLNPRKLAEYFLNINNSEAKRFIGHNPALSYAAILMYLFTIGLVSSGIMMSLQINEHFFEEVHEVFAHLFLIISILHILGVIYHQFIHQDNIIMSMINGNKMMNEDESGIKSNRLWSSVFLLAFFSSISFTVLNNFNSSTGELNILGKTLQLGESEKNEHKENQLYNDNESEEEDDD